jgi:hypothetical protein
VASAKTFTPPAAAKRATETASLAIADAPSSAGNLVATPGLASPAQATQQPKLAPSSAPSNELPAAAGRYSEHALTTGIVPPRVVHQVQPRLPSDVRLRLKSEIIIDIKVQIDAAGRVTEARPVAQTGHASLFLVSTAKNAALQWIFEPAKRGTQNVPSEVVLKFRYHPSS